MTDLTGDYMILGNRLEKADEGLIGTMFRDHYIYEVFRVVRRIPLFLEDHLERLRLSLQRCGYEATPDALMLTRLTRELCAAHLTSEGNVKIMIPPSVPLNAPQIPFCIHFVEHHYPSADEYENGAVLGILESARTNPPTKRMQGSLRNEANRMIEDGHLAEVLLVSDDGCVTEGSRSNIFFIKDDVVYTPVADMVLSGITRAKVFDICRNGGITLKEAIIKREEMQGFQAAFNTGTSRKVLPVKEIGEFSFTAHHPLTGIIMKGFDDMVEVYLQLQTRAGL